MELCVLHLRTALLGQSSRKNTRGKVTDPPPPRQAGRAEGPGPSETGSTKCKPAAPSHPFQLGSTQSLALVHTKKLGFEK
ncbi:uncharacterized [Tachysurus ichikawai]